MIDQTPSAAPAGTGQLYNLPGAEAPGYKWKVLSTVIFGIFMVILDTTVVNVAFQTIRDEFGGSLANTQWVISIYVLVLGISTPLAGYLANRFGAKKIYLGGLASFAFGSMMCGIAPTLPLLIAARALQGLGGGMAMPLGIALLLQAFPVREHGKALGLFGIAALVAPAIGPILGGWLADQNLWRVIFFINPPIGLAGVLLGIRFLHEKKSTSRPTFDLAGMITEIIGFGAILYAASTASFFGWGSLSTLAFLSVGLLGMVAFAIVETRYAKEPLLDLRLFRNRIFLNSNLLGYVSTVALFGAEFLMPIYLQALRGRSALQTGFILLPMAIAGGIFVSLSGRIYDKIGPRPLMVSGFTLLMINTWQLSQIRADTGIDWIVFLLVIRGLALGLTVQTTMVTSLSVVPRSELPRASSLTNATRLVVQSIGVALLATILSSTLSSQVKTKQDQMSSIPAIPGVHPPGLCEFTSVSQPANSKTTTGSQPVILACLVSPLSSQSGTAPVKPPATGTNLAALACQQNIAGFELAYRVTFFAALAALIFGLTLPGWPGKWAGRQDNDSLEG